MESLLAHHSVSQTLYRYASAVDMKDWETLRSLFTDDADGTFGDREPLLGADTIVAWIQDSTKDCVWQHHLLSVYHVDLVAEDRAEALTYHTSHQISSDDADSVRLLVGRYRDRLQRVGDRWLIASKNLEVGWRETRRR
jgi:3-phenylpropionate/cinnamic acid dioxygenase small subunit